MEGGGPDAFSWLNQARYATEGPCSNLGLLVGLLPIQDSGCFGPDIFVGILSGHLANGLAHRRVMQVVAEIDQGSTSDLRLFVDQGLLSQKGGGPGGGAAREAMHGGGQDRHVLVL